MGHKHRMARRRTPCRTHLDRISNASRSHLERISIASRTHLDRISIASRSHLDSRKTPHTKRRPPCRYMYDSAEDASSTPRRTSPKRTHKAHNPLDSSGADVLSGGTRHHEVALSGTYARAHVSHRNTSLKPKPSLRGMHPHAPMYHTQLCSATAIIILTNTFTSQRYWRFAALPHTSLPRGASVSVFGRGPNQTAVVMRPRS